MLNIVLFGPPGAGKGTQSEKLIAAYQLVHLSTGDILRAEIAAGTALGAEAKKLMDEGVLVPDEIVIDMISSKLDQNRNAKGFIFDGFPRTTKQAKALDELLADKNTSLTKIISLKVSDEELMDRLLQRGRESGRMDDQNEDIIQNRIQEYNSKTAPLEDYYEQQGKLEEVDGIGDINEIFYSISKVIDKETNEEEEEELVNSEMGESESLKKGEESFVSKVTHIAKVVKDVISSKVHDVMHPEERNGSEKAAKKAASKKKPATKKVNSATAKSTKKATPAKKAATKKNATKKAAPAKKAASKKTAKKVVKKAAKKTIKKVLKKAAAKKSVKKVVKKAAKKIVKKTAGKITRKIAAKKTAAKKIVKKAAKKATPKKVLKKVVKKAKSAGRTIKKVVKKAAKKATTRKAAAKKTAKKTGKKRK